MYHSDDVSVLQPIKTYSNLRVSPYCSRVAVQTKMAPDARHKALARMSRYSYAGALTLSTKYYVSSVF